MNSKERVEWLKAVRACLPDLDMRAMADSSAAADAPGRWEVSVRGGELRKLGLRFFGTADYAAWRASASSAFALAGPLPDAPREGFPWLAASWDLESGAWTSVRLTGAAKESKLKAGQAEAFEFRPDGTSARRLLKPTPFKTGIFKEPALDRALEDFSRLCPLKSLSVEEPGWSLRFAQSLRWPLFARCDLSSAFTPHSSQLALFLLDRRVTELSFDGEALWAHCAG